MKMKALKIVACILFTLMTLFFMVLLGINYYSQGFTEEQQKKLISISNEIAMEYQGKDIIGDDFLVKEDDKEIQLFKENGNFIFRISLNEEETSTRAQIEYPAKVDNGKLHIGTEWPNIKDTTSLTFEDFCIREFLFIIFLLCFILPMIS